MSKQLLIYVEGKTEREFAESVLFPHFTGKGISCCNPVIAANSEKGAKDSRGGVNSYKAVKEDIETLLDDCKSGDFRLTTLFDLYGLPTDFPGVSQCPSIPTGRGKARAVAAALKQDITDSRFMPFIFSYEFETLVLADPDSLLAAYPDANTEVSALKADIEGFDNPEEINDSSETAPSKRIRRHLDYYDKATDGPICVMDSGLDKIRQRCPHFDEWMCAMESL